MSCAGESSDGRSGEDVFDGRHVDFGLRVFAGRFDLVWVEFVGFEAVVCELLCVSCCV